MISAKEETSFLSDVPLDIEVELDRQTMTLAEVAGLRPGGVGTDEVRGRKCRHLYRRHADRIRGDCGYREYHGRAHY